MSEKKISRSNTPARLYARDEAHIRRKVKGVGYADTRFKDNSSAVRHYVYLGIVTEQRTETANTLDDRIIKASQKEVVTDSLRPLKSSIDGLITAMELFGEKQDEYFISTTKRTNILIGRVEGLNEQLSDRLSVLLHEVFRNGKVTEAALRNAIVLRSILYVFLLGYKTGRIVPNDGTSWADLITFTHKKAQELSFTEIQQLADGPLETKIVEQMASEMFLAIRKMQQTPIRTMEQTLPKPAV